jgi:hypothetical protein
LTNHTQQRQFWSGGWWRFTRYEIREGSIRPAENADLQWYDPWEIYRKSEWHTGTPRPYQSLVELVLSIGGFYDEAHLMWRLERSPDAESLISFKDDSLTSDEQRKILDWCSRFGLLGILPHNALTIELPLRFAPRVGKGLHFEREHVRVNGKWLRSVRATCTPPVAKRFQFFADDIDLLNNDDPVLGALLGENDEYYRVPKIAHFSKDQTGITPHFNGNMPIAQVLPRFFPDFEAAGDRFECPLPLTPKFWRIYSERTHDFLESAIAFLGAVEPLLTHRAGASPLHLEWFLEPIGVSLSSDSEHGVQERWVCPSLLSSFARMALQDISAGRRIALCDCCGSPFVTSGYQARYCSQPCGWKHRKRRARLQMK